MGLFKKSFRTEFGCTPEGIRCNPEGIQGDPKEFGPILKEFGAIWKEFKATRTEFPWHASQEVIMTHNESRWLMMSPDPPILKNINFNHITFIETSNQSPRQNKCLRGDLLDKGMVWGVFAGCCDWFSGNILKHEGSPNPKIQHCVRRRMGNYT